MLKTAAQFYSPLAIVFLLTGSATGEPFDLRGFRLGITLQEFKDTPFPDPGYANVQVICADKNSDSYLVDLPRIDAQAGVIRCIHYGKWQAVGGMDIHAQLDLAGTSVPISFDFWTRGATEPQLFRIFSDFTNERWDSLLTAYTARYKKPASIQQSAVQNAYGAKFVSTTVRWNQDGSSIYLVSRASRLDWMRILYVLNASQTDYEAVVRKMGTAGKL
jgi:hypothetical protein